MTQIHQDPDLAVELFVLEPDEDSVAAEHVADHSEQRAVEARSGSVPGPK